MGSKLAKHLGLSIKAVRESHGLSQRDLGFAAGVSQVTLSQIENGLVETNVGIIERIAEQLGVSPAELLGKESPQAEPPAEHQIPHDILAALERCNETELAAVRAVLGGFKRSWDALAASRQESEQLAHHRKRKA